METLAKQTWFLGDLNPDAAAAVLCSSGQNAFIVYKDTDKDTFVLAFSVQNEGEDLKEAVKSLAIKYVDGKYMVEGQNRQNDDVIEAIKSFAATHSPPLLPAFDKNFMTQMSITSVNSDPPPYSQADRALQPDIAPLPNLNELDKDPGVQPEQIFESNLYIPPSPQYAHGSDWHYYTNHHRCHPKNVCHACCHADGDFYLPCRKGPLLALCIILVWIIVLLLLITVLLPFSPVIAIVAGCIVCIVCCCNN
eukprot:Em0007g996a